LYKDLTSKFLYMMTFVIIDDKGMFVYISPTPSPPGGVRMGKMDISEMLRKNGK